MTDRRQLLVGASLALAGSGLALAPAAAASRIEIRAYRYGTSQRPISIACTACSVFPNSVTMTVEDASTILAMERQHWLPQPERAEDDRTPHSDPPPSGDFLVVKQDRVWLVCGAVLRTGDDNKSVSLSPVSVWELPDSTEVGPDMPGYQLTVRRRDDPHDHNHRHRLFNLSRTGMRFQVQEVADMKSREKIGSPIEAGDHFLHEYTYGWKPRRKTPAEILAEIMAKMPSA